ncbi:MULTISPECIES: flagellar hook-basal body complex protein FliE [Novosphingobium]|jgi:flagellar hook-basal body complex protein FliE|uniref:Flagellar hook-basal body complex protein FliE n=1 Tax=Novosphingobium subterraneum TaxID=48936 RepID=A0A0B8ZMH5_9SPHN|nr:MULTISPECIES: flagellar hook-basal body complex protein FliE [Novosphingobium]KHS44328.1 flagellar hook-basal body complex protein FliE [Novosphingobium subterraneum]QOV94311.1 flagellar hook-basal body complex protein FliE [Novosphingobium sp. ES2-1]
MSVSGIGGRASGIQDIMALRQQIMERSQLLQQVKSPEATQGAQGPQASTGPAGSFTESLKGALDNVNASQQKASAISEAYEKGEVVDVAKVMLARQEAGVAFEATLQVRNKLLNAYQDIMRMGV